MAENIIELSALANLSSYNVNISKMNLMSSDLESDFVFTLVRPNISLGSYSNFNIEYGSLSNSFIKDFKTSDLTLKNKWAFSKENGTAKIKTNAIYGSENFNKAVLNKETYEKECISKIFDLSAEIYKKPHLFSHIGEIVCSHNLSTEDKMKEIFGSNTRWRQINGRFIIGVGKNEANNIESKYGVLEANALNIALSATGGESMVKLNTDNLITHNHKLKAEQYNFTLSYEIHADSTLKIYTGTYNQRDHGSAVKYHKATMGTLAVITFKAEAEYSTKKLYGNLSISNSIYSPTTREKQTQVAHNNMPPTIYEYVWQRIS